MNQYGKLLKDLQMNNPTNEPLLAKEGKIISQLKDTSTSSQNPTGAMCAMKLNKPNEIAKHVSFVVVIAIICLGPFFDMWIEPSLMKLQNGQALASSIRLLGFMVFVWAVSIMILVGVPFVRMQSFALICWAIWMQIKS
ncbi:unnamed protein product [Trifolium pratense]|uniref:Uncharacterized protein n=2 Tax=Trifolium pratense TaxID=57577 RepID=A0ACB0IB46_TRIPR|nr:unnamed protein product [Trifolium pratense]CAJ2629325.1 unnamed protein product [Trifolium pratense]